MITSGELFKRNAFGHIMPIGYKYNDIIIKFEEEAEEEAEEIERLKEKQKRLKEEMLKKKRIEKDEGKNGEPH